MTQKKKGIAGAFGGNLLSNAIKFTRSGTVTLSTGYKNGIFTLTVEKMLKHISMPHSQVPPLNPQSKSDNHHRMAQPSTVLRWTGKASDLVEILYGMAEMGCVNDGEIPVGELADIFYSLFDMEAKDCYRIYSDLKLRKNDSRTYFLDKMQEKLNRRMEMDEEKDRARK